MHRPAVKIQGSKSSKFHMGQETSRHKKSCTSLLSCSHLLDQFALICAKLTRNLSEKYLSLICLFLTHPPFPVSAFCGDLFHLASIFAIQIRALESLSFTLGYILFADPDFRWITRRSSLFTTLQSLCQMSLLGQRSKPLGEIPWEDNRSL